jgi:glucan biosynthesis protein
LSAFILARWHYDVGGVFQMAKGLRLKKYKNRIKVFRQMLATLNPQAAKFIAFENERRIF